MGGAIEDTSHTFSEAEMEKEVLRIFFLFARKRMEAGFLRFR